MLFANEIKLKDKGREYVRFTVGRDDLCWFCFI